MSQDEQKRKNLLLNSGPINNNQRNTKLLQQKLELVLNIHRTKHDTIQLHKMVLTKKNTKQNNQRIKRKR